MAALCTRIIVVFGTILLLVGFFILRLLVFLIISLLWFPSLPVSSFISLACLTAPSLAYYLFALFVYFSGSRCASELGIGNASVVLLCVHVPFVFMYSGCPLIIQVVLYVTPSISFN